jgi:hypothetical protein
MTVSVLLSLWCWLVCFWCWLCVYVCVCVWMCVNVLLCCCECVCMCVNVLLCCVSCAVTCFLSCCDICLSYFLVCYCFLFSLGCYGVGCVPNPPPKQINNWFVFATLSNCCHACSFARCLVHSVHIGCCSVKISHSNPRCLVHSMHIGCCSVKLSHSNPRCLVYMYSVHIVCDSVKFTS